MAKCLPQSVKTRVDYSDSFEDDEEEIEEPVSKPKKEKKGKKSKNGEVIVYKAATPSKPAPAPYKSAATVDLKNQSRCLLLPPSLHLMSLL